MSFGTGRGCGGKASSFYAKTIRYKNRQDKIGQVPYVRRRSTMYYTSFLSASVDLIYRCISFVEYVWQGESNAWDLLWYALTISCASLRWPLALGFWLQSDIHLFFFNAVDHWRYDNHAYLFPATMPYVSFYPIITTCDNKWIQSMKNIYMLL